LGGEDARGSRRGVRTRRGPGLDDRHRTVTIPPAARPGEAGGAMARLLVTGGCGYVGSHALRALVRAGHEAVVLDDLRAGTATFAGRAPLVRADVGDRDALERLWRTHGPFDGVLHFAASTSVSESVADPLLYYRNNAAASAALLATAL